MIFFVIAAIIALGAGEDHGPDELTCDPSGERHSKQEVFLLAGERIQRWVRVP
jgi:hypothetical protein